MKVPTSFGTRSCILIVNLTARGVAWIEAAWRASLLSGVPSRANMTSPSRKAAYRRSRLRSILHEQHRLQGWRSGPAPPLAEIDEGYFG